MAERSGGAGRGWGLLRTMVLAAAGMAGLPRRNSGRGALAMAGSHTVGAGIRGGSTLRLGLWLDRTRNPCAYRSASAISGSGLLSLCAQPDVRGFCRGLDRAVDRLRTRQSKSDRRSRSCCAWRTFVCCLLRRVLQERQALVATLTSVERAINSHAYLAPNT